MKRENVVSCVNVEIMITDSRACVYTEIQMPKDCMFNEVSENIETNIDIPVIVDCMPVDIVSHEDAVSHVILKDVSEAPPQPEVPGEPTWQEPTERTKTPDSDPPFHVSNQSPSPTTRLTSTTIVGHEKAPFFDSPSTINEPGPSQPGPSQPGPSQPGPSQPRPTVARDSRELATGEIYDYIYEKKQKWRFQKEFPISFQAVLDDGEVILDTMSYTTDTRLLKFFSRKDLDINEEAVPLHRKNNKNEKQLKASKGKKTTKQKHARTNQRDDVFEFSQSLEYCLTDIPESRQTLIYKETYLSSPLKFLMEHHKLVGKAPQDQSSLKDYCDKHIWPELKETYRYAEIMQRPIDENDASWESSCK